MAVILSDMKGFYEVPETYRELVCVLDTGLILVSRDKVADPWVASYIRRIKQQLQKDGIEDAELRLVDLQTIRTERDDAETPANGRSSSSVEPSAAPSKMMREAEAIFHDAVANKASDIHLRLEKEDAKLLYRVHGDLTPAPRGAEMPREHALNLMRSIYNSMSDVSETAFKERARQDARIADPKKLPGELHGLRIATSPTVDGMLMVLRLLYHSLGGSDILGLGYGNDHLDQFSLMMSRPYGINFVSGPTGSGKSTTLQRLLSKIYEQTQGRANIMTVEDPPEYPIIGAVQTPVVAENEAQRAEAFRAAIRSALRLDPDIIMIGEIRDHESAQLAIDAAMTGHQVWTTIHANNAMAIYNRLIEIKVPLETLCDPALITGLTAQRLVRRLCPDCKMSLFDAERKGVIRRALVHRLHRATEENVSDVCVRIKGAECPTCEGKGVIGRTVVSEIVVPDTQLCDLLLAGKRTDALRYWQEEQRGRSMLQHALDKVKTGEVDPGDAEAEVGPLSMDLIAGDGKIYNSEIRETVDSLRGSVTTLKGV